MRKFREYHSTHSLTLVPKKMHMMILRRPPYKTFFLLKCSSARTVLSTHSQGGSPGLVVMGGDSCSKGCGFKSWHCILDGHYSHIFVVKIEMMFA